MKVAVFSTKQYDREFLGRTNADFGHELVFFETRLAAGSCKLAEGFQAVCVFVNDQLDATVLRALSEGGTRVIALRCAGFNNVDLQTSEILGLTVIRVPAYSPYAVAEHTIGMMLSSVRKIHRAYLRVREGNFSLEGLLGFDLHGKTVGVVGTGKIGFRVARILSGFGCQVLAFDIAPDPNCKAIGVRYTSVAELLTKSDIITLHCPLTPETHHFVDRRAIKQMKDGVILMNTSRGALVETRAVIEGLKLGRIGFLAIDVYEEESDLFFEDLSNKVIHDDVFARLLTFPNVLITSHQAFFTREALQEIARTTLENLKRCEEGRSSENIVGAKLIR